MNSRRKGHNFERTIAKQLRAVFDPPELTEAIASTGPSQDLVDLLQKSRVRRGDQCLSGKKEPDIVIAERPWWLELKVGAKPEPVKALVQAEGDSGQPDGRHWPVAVCKQDRKPITATMRLSTLAMLLERVPALGRAVVTIGWDELLRVMQCLEPGRRLLGKVRGEEGHRSSAANGNGQEGL
jgi:hypothetical protein